MERDAAPALIVCRADDQRYGMPLHITFTTNDASPPRQGLWGGLIIMGDATVYSGTDEVEVTGYLRWHG